MYGMSGTPELNNNETYAAHAKVLFGVAPTEATFTEEEKEELMDDINPQRKVSTRKNRAVEELPVPTQTAKKLYQLNTLLVGNALKNDIRGITAVKP